MAGKKKIEKEGSSWIGEVEKYSRQIWLAGLGAYSKISNDGSKLFETLVKDGEKAEKQTKNGVDKQVDAAKATAKTAKSRVGDVKDLAMGKWSELEGAFDKRLNSAISRLGVPSRNEVKALHSKVDLLTKQIEKLTGASVAPASKAAAAKPVAKPLVKAAAKPAAKPAAKAPTKTAAAKPATKA
ncbi:phasin family protein, partial [Pseudomonas sp. MH10]